MFIQYGLQITTNQTGLTDYAIGLVQGVLQWITGRASIDLWKEGIVFEGSFSEVTQDIEIAPCGSYATMSEFNLEIDNATGLNDTIVSLGLNLSQADAILYCFRKENETDAWTFTKDWTGKLSNWIFDNNKIKISFMDSFRGIHKPLLKKVFSTAEFGNRLPSNLVGASMPLAFGYVSKAKLFPIIKQQIFDNICQSSGVDYDVAPCTNYTVTGSSEAYKVYTVYLKTVDKTFAINELKGKFLVIVKGGSGSCKIRSNLASSGGITQITLYGKFSATPVFWSTTGADVTYFQISSLVIRYVVSQKPVEEFASINNKGSLFVWDDNALEFDEISEIGGTFDASNIDNTGYPGCEILSKPSNVLGDTFYYKYKPLSTIVEDAETISNGGAVTGSRPSPGHNTEMPLLADVDGSTYYSWACTSSASARATLTIPFRTKIDPSFLKGNFSNILVAFNQTLSFDTVNDFEVFLNIKLNDFLGRITAPLDTVDRVIFGNTPGGAFSSFDLMIPSDYGIFAGPTAPDILSNLRDSLAINQTNQNIEKVVDLEIYPSITLELKYQWRQLIGNSQMTLLLNEFTLVGEKSLNLITTDLFSQVKGLKFDSTWEGRKTATLPVTNIADMIEAFIRIFDGRPDVISKTYFDLLGDSSTGLRKNWYVGQQIEKEVNTAEIIDELCRFGFFGLVPRNDGTRAPKAWMQNTSIATHNDTNGTIVENSIGEKKPTSLADVYNLPQVNYGWNPESQKYEAFLAIAKIEDSAFPLQATLDSAGVPLWKSYAIGYLDAEYNEGKQNWEYCHESFVKYGFVRPLPDEMANCKWFPNIEVDWSLSATYNAAKAYMRELCKWTPFRKLVIPYNLPNTAEHAARELLDRITFSESVYRSGATFQGVIVSKSVNPGLNKDYIAVSLMLDPEI